MKVKFLLKTIFTNTYLLNNINDTINSYEVNINESLNKYLTDLPINFDMISNLMEMCHSAYNNNNEDNWEKIHFNKTKSIGIDLDSIQGYVFSDETGYNNIIAIKGTSISLLPDSHNSTVLNDKYNDNLFFSCCYYQESSIFKNTCISKPNICDSSCYKDSLHYPFNYINILDIILENIKSYIDFDNTNVYFTGHSLGGFLATVAGIKTNKQVITFESPGEKNYLDLINLQYQDSRIYHFGHTADIIMKGECTLCNWSGYNLKTKCHIGHTCIYDSKTKLKLTDSMNTHRIEYIIDNILPHWKNDFPDCIYRESCIEDNCKKFTYT